MTDTLVHYHVEDGVGRPSINVKVRAPGTAFWPDDLEGPFDTVEAANIVETAYDRVQSDFWQAAEQIADERGLGEIEQQGRSGGWLVFTECDPNTPEHWKEAGEITEWLAGYRSMVEWADEYIGNAPAMVARLAQSMAMDEAGEPAALRMFAFGRTA